ncbi:hypothetical protein EMCRGX_G000026 [Ephydatia muelleri]
MKRAVFTSPDKTNDIHTGDQIPPTNHSSQFKDFEDKVLRNADDTQCSQCRRANGPYSGEVLTLSDEERRALLDTAGILSTIEIGAAETLAIKAGLAIPWNKLRLLRRAGLLTWHDGYIPARDDDDSIVKHKLATTAVREKPSTSAARVVEARARLPRGLC